MMAQLRGLVNIVKSKLSFVSSQKNELQGLLDAYVDKATSEAMTAIEADSQELSAVKEVNSMLETVLEVMLGLSGEIEDHISGSAAKSLDLHHVKSSASPSVSALTSDKSVQDKEKQYSARLDAIENTLKEMTSKHTEAVTAGNSRLEKAEKKLTKLESDKGREASRLDSVVDDLQNLKSQYKKQQQPSRLSDIEKQVESLTSRCSVFQERMKDVDQVKVTVEEVTSRMESLADKSDLYNVMKDTRTITRSVEELTSRVAATEQTVKSSVSCREKEENKRREMEDRLAVLEAKRDKDFDIYSRNQEDLQRSVTTVSDRVKELSAQVVVRNTQVQQSPVGFTVYYDNVHFYSFTDIRCNHGNAYDDGTCKFQAPRDGLYVTSLTLVQKDQGRIVAFVMQRSPNTAHYEAAIMVCTEGDKMSSCGVGVVFMKAGDTLDVEIDDEQHNLSDKSIFTCFSLS